MLNLEIDLAEQSLFVFDEQKVIKKFSISTSLHGAGEVRDSGKTPRGWHMIRAKIGNACPLNTVFVGRRPTGEIYSQALGEKFPHRDWILTRILWLSGLEIGKNRLGRVDTLQRYIYIHGVPDTVKLGEPSSKGCIRMGNLQLIELFDKVQPGTKILIKE